MTPQTWMASIALSVGLAVGGFWDDESFLGRGPMVMAGVSVPMGRHLAAEGEVSVGTHHRDEGYLAVSGTPIGVTGRLAYIVTGPQSRVRPFLSGGATWLHSSGDLTLMDQRAHWSTSNFGWEAGAGAEIRGTNRISWRPEARLTLTGPGTMSAPGSPERPLAVIRGGVTMLWR